MQIAYCNKLQHSIHQIIANHFTEKKVSTFMIRYGELHQTSQQRLLDFLMEQVNFYLVFLKLQVIENI